MQGSWIAVQFNISSEEHFLEENILILVNIGFR